MKKYHVNPETGDSGECRAKKTCPFGGESMHYLSLLDAQHRYEREMFRQQNRYNQIEEESKVEDIDTSFVTSNSFTVPAGKYFIGDPYIAISMRDQKGWNDIVRSIDSQFGWENDILDPADEKKVAVGAKYNDGHVLALKSWFGDGTHWSFGPVQRIPSDSGLIGVVSFDQIERLGWGEEDFKRKRWGRVQEFDKPLTFEREPNGGYININGTHKNIIVHGKILNHVAYNELNNISIQAEKREQTATENTLKLIQVNFEKYNSMAEEFDRT